MVERGVFLLSAVLAIVMVMVWRSTFDVITRYLAPRERLLLVGTGPAAVRGKLPMDRLLDVRMQSGVLFDHLASVYEEYTGKIALENLRPSWLVFSTDFRNGRWFLLAKRTCDVVAALCGLVLASPLMLASMLLLKLESPRDPVLYHQERVGLHGRPFTIHKFRTMRINAELGTGPVWSRVMAIRASRRSDGSCARRASTRFRSCGTCCAAT